MLNVAANPLFARKPHIENNEHLKYIIVKYQPKNYWSDDAITARIDFKRISNRGVVDTGFTCEGNMVTFDVRHAGGGNNSGAGIDPIETIENFQLALGDAIGLVKHVKARVLAGATFLQIANEIAGIDMETPKQDDGAMPILIVHIGDSIVVSKGSMFVNEEVAKTRLGTLYSGRSIQFEMRDATEQEAHYWWFKLSSHQAEVIQA
jgi:hypothetical protein